jgi:hypothetical protein
VTCKRVQRTAAIARGILDLRTDLTERFAFPAHLTRRETPFVMTGNAAGLKIRVLMADRTAHRREASAIRSPLDRRLVNPAQFTLMRTIAGGMAIDAAWTGQDFAKLGKQRRGPRRGVANAGKCFWSSERRRSAVGRHACH